jgi:hypothetical protein
MIVDYDRGVLENLMRIVGPGRTDGFLAQLARDLDQTLTAIGPATDRLDWTELRRLTHNLIALSGTIGADRLHSAALRMNHDSNTENPAEVAVSFIDVANLTARLIAQLQTLRDKPTLEDRTP